MYDHAGQQYLLTMVRKPSSLALNFSLGLITTCFFYFLTIAGRIRMFPSNVPIIKSFSVGDIIKI
jgi:hypothetical protein